MTTTPTLEHRIRFTEEDFEVVRELSERHGVSAERVIDLMRITDTAPAELMAALAEGLRTNDVDAVLEASYGLIEEQWNVTSQKAKEVIYGFFDAIKQKQEAQERSERSANRLGLYGTIMTVAALGLGIYAFRGKTETPATLDIPKYTDTKEKDGIRRTFKADAIGSSEDSSVLIRNEAFTTVNNAVARAEYNDRHSNRLHSRHQYTAKELHRLHQAMDNLTTESSGAITPQEAYRASLKIGETGGLSQLLEGKK